MTLNTVTIGAYTVEVYGGITAALSTTSTLLKHD